MAATSSNRAVVAGLTWRVRQVSIQGLYPVHRQHVRRARGCVGLRGLDQCGPHDASLEPEDIQALIQKARPLIAGMSDQTQLTVQGGKGLPG